MLKKREKPPQIDVLDLESIAMAELAGISESISERPEPANGIPDVPGQDRTHTDTCGHKTDSTTPEPRLDHDTTTTRPRHDHDADRDLVGDVGWEAGGETVVQHDVTFAPRIPGLEGMEITLLPDDWIKPPDDGVYLRPTEAKELTRIPQKDLPLAMAVKTCFKCDVIPASWPDAKRMDEQIERQEKQYPAGMSRQVHPSWIQTLKKNAESARRHAAKKASGIL